MNRWQRRCLLIAASLALACSLVSPSIAQTGKADQLSKRVEGLYQAGKYAEAIPLAQQALAIYEKALGPDRLEVAHAQNLLAVLYSVQSRFADAEPLYKQSLAIREKVLGPEHPDVARALGNLASLYSDEGRYADAEPLLKRSVAIQQKTLGADHAEVGDTLYNLAAVYQDEGRYADAEPLFKRALAIQEKASGPNDAVVATRLNGLASLYHNQGRYADAEPLYKRSAAIQEKALGPDHPNIAAVLANLAMLYHDQGRYADAETLYKRSLAIREKTFGPNHPGVAETLDNLAQLSFQKGDYADAEPLFRRALAIREKVLGPDHPFVAQSLNSLAVLYQTQRRYADAEPLYTRALVIAQKALGPDHARVAGFLHNLATLYDVEGRYADAEPPFKQALAIRIKVLGPDHPDVARSLNNLALLYREQGRYADAEPLLKQALAIYEKALGPDHEEVARSLNNLADLYRNQNRYADALPLVRRTLTNKSAATVPALPVLVGAEAAKLISPGEAIDDGLDVVQQASQTSAGKALNALTVRFAAGSDRLAQLVRQDQDLTGEAAALDKAIIAAVAKEPAQRDAAQELRIRERVAAIAKERDALQAVFRREFPDYAALSNPQSLSLKDIQPLLADDEALVVVHVDNKKSYVWVVGRNTADWKELAVAADDVSRQVAALRRLLDSSMPLDPQASFTLYRQILAPVENSLTGKPRLSLVLDGALTSLPPQLLVMRDPTGKALKSVDWLVRTHSVTVLPSIASLKVLRSKSAVAGAGKPLIGFANPIFDPTPQQIAQNTSVVAEMAVARGIRGTVADVAELRTALPSLPETADELKKVAAGVHADPKDLITGADATETRVKAAKLDEYGIVYFATHGLLAGEVANFAKLNAEPALVLTLPEHPTQLDDGLLTASEVAQLKLNADWVVLSACNTAAAEKPGAEALSGLARAFFYAGARSLVVSNWEVNSESTVELMTAMFAALAANRKLSHGEALQKSMLAMIDNRQHAEWADPQYWAPFVVVGEPAKPAN
jgi:CHAT domain-containing protein/Tfp pilus assembly protein PilF